MQNSLPTNWQEYTIDELKANKPHALAMGPFGSNIKTDNFVDDGIPIIRGVNLTQGKLNLNDFVYLTEEKADELRSSNAFPGDLVFTHRGTLGQVGLIPERPYPRYVVSQSQMKLSVNTDIVDPIFLFYYFKAIGNKELLTHVAGAGVPAIANPLTTLKKLRLSVPPLSYQKQIASILTAFDDKIDLNNKIAKTLEEMAQAIFKEWFINFRFPGSHFAKASRDKYEKVEFVENELGKIPEGWEYKKLSYISEYINRGISPTYDDSSDMLIINQRCIRDKKITLTNARRHNSFISADKLIKFGDILINSTGVGTLGRVAQVYFIPQNITVDSHVSIVRPSNLANIDFFGMSLINKQSYFESQALGSTGQVELGREIISNMPIVVAPLKIQNLYGEIVNPMRSKIEKIEVENQKLAALRDLLLPKLMNGAIVVKNE